MLCRNIGESESALLHLLANGLGTDTYVPSPPSRFLHHRNCGCVIATQRHDDRSGGFLDEKPKVSGKLARSGKSIELCFSRTLCNFCFPKGLPMNEATSIGKREMNCVS